MSWQCTSIRHTSLIANLSYCETFLKFRRPRERNNVSVRVRWEDGLLPWLRFVPVHFVDNKNPVTKFKFNYLRVCFFPF